jgi:hypothetical protein
VTRGRGRMKNCGGQTGTEKMNRDLNSSAFMRDVSHDSTGKVRLLPEYTASHPRTRQDSALSCGNLSKGRHRKHGTQDVTSLPTAEAWVRG